MESHSKQFTWRQLPMALGNGDMYGNEYVTRVQMLSTMNKRSDSPTRSSGSVDSSIDIFHGTTSLSVSELERELTKYQPFKIRWMFPSFDHNTDVYEEQSIALHWQKVTRELKAVSPLLSVSSLSLSMPNNRHCISFASDFLKNVSLPNLKTLELADNFSDPNQYSSVFQKMSQDMPQIEVLAIRNTSMRQSPKVSTSFCTNLASLIRSSSSLREIYIIGIEFSSVDDWTRVSEALTNSVSITNVSVGHLSITNTPMIGKIKCDNEFFTREVEHNERYMENRLCTQYLANTLKLASPYTMLQRLEALMHVRGYQKQPDRLDSDQKSYGIQMTDKLAIISDRIDSSFDFIRHVIDPSVLLTVRSNTLLAI